MANQFKLQQKVANRLLLILKNQLVMGRLCDSGLASDFDPPRTTFRSVAPSMFGGRRRSLPAMVQSSKTRTLSLALFR